MIRRFFLLSAAAVATLAAQTYTTLWSFNGADGANPRAALIQASDGNFYGTARMGGANGEGAIFKITPSGALTTLYSFCAQSGCPDGQMPGGALLEVPNGNFYGTTTAGGPCGPGTIFQITSGGALTTVQDFCGSGAGYTLTTALIQGTDGNFYGTTYWGPGPGWGTMFQLTPSGTFTTLYDFCPDNGKCPNGANPEQLIQGSDGNFYGTDFIGGPSGYGTVFKYTPGTTPVTLYSFCHGHVIGCPGGGNPEGGLVEASNGNFYGVAPEVVFEITPGGTFTRLHTFCTQTGCPDGDLPEAALIQANDGNLYGTTAVGGAYNAGTIFRITPAGKLTTLYSFCAQSGCADGKLPLAGLVQATDGDLYGTTYYGGTNGDGVVYRLSIGLGPLEKR